MWEENTPFSNIFATCASYSGNHCVIVINICIFSSCLLNSSHPNQHIRQAKTCCNVCYKETTLGKSGIHRSCLSDENTKAVPAVKQLCNKNTLQVADWQAADKISIDLIRNKQSYPQLLNLPEFSSQMHRDRRDENPTSHMSWRNLDYKEETWLF